MAGTVGTAQPETAAELAAAAAAAERDADALEARMVDGSAEPDVGAIDTLRTTARKLGLLARRRQLADERARTAQRQAALKQLRADIEATGQAMDADNLAATIAERDAAAARVAGIIEGHNDRVTILRSRALSLGVGAVGPGGPRATDGHVGTIDHHKGGGIQAGAVLVRHVATEKEYIAAAGAVRRTPTPPGSLYISVRSGAIIDISEAEPPVSFRQQLLDGELIDISDLIPDFTAGQFEIPADLDHRRAVQMDRMARERAAAQAAARAENGA